MMSAKCGAVQASTSSVLSGISLLPLEDREHWEASAQHAHDQRIHETGKRAQTQRRRRRHRRPVRHQQLRQSHVGLRPVGRILRQTVEDGFVEAARDITAHGTKSRRRFLQHACNQANRLAIRKRLASGEQVIKSGASRVDVGPEVEGLSAKLLGRGECQRAAGAPRSDG